MMFCVHNTHNQKLKRIPSTTLSQPNSETRKRNRLKIPPRTQTLHYSVSDRKSGKRGLKGKFSKYSHIHHLVNNVRIESAQFSQTDLTQTVNIEFTKTV
jgi:hypothetical protein